MAFYSRPLTADDLESQRGLPVPRFQPGDLVRTVVGIVGDGIVRTEVTAPVALFGWHWKRETWLYKLGLPGRRGGRWYLECQLQPVIRPS
jgi:hypothetical protein